MGELSRRDAPEECLARPADHSENSLKRMQLQTSAEVTRRYTIFLAPGVTSRKRARRFYGGTVLAAGSPRHGYARIRRLEWRHLARVEHGPDSPDLTERGVRARLADVRIGRRAEAPRTRSTKLGDLAARPLGADVPRRVRGVPSDAPRIGHRGRGRPRRALVGS